MAIERGSAIYSLPTQRYFRGRFSDLLYHGTGFSLIFRAPGIPSSLESCCKSRFLLKCRRYWRIGGEKEQQTYDM